MGDKLLNSLVSFEWVDGAMRDGSRRDTTENSRGRVAQDAASVPRHWGGTEARADGLSPLAPSTAPTKPRGARFCLNASRVVERRHHLAREQIDGAQHLGEREIAEGELPDEIVGAGLLHLRLDHARHSGGRARDAAAAVLDLIEVRRPLSASGAGAVHVKEMMEM